MQAITAGPIRSAAAAGALLLLLPGVSLAAPVSCHCFRDRAFDPAAPAAADPYLLAATQNTYFAAVFGIPKRAVVQAKMKGVSGEDLWTAYYAGALLKVPPERLMSAREQARSWKESLEGGPALAPLDRRFRDLLDRDASEKELAAAAAADVVVRTLGLAREELDPLLDRRVSTGKIVASSLLSRWSGRSPTSILAEIDGGGATWGSLMNGLGIHPEVLEERIGALVGRRRKD